MILKAVLFDLDNTLILFNEKTFYDAYNQKLYTHFADIMSIERFSQKLFLSTQMLLNNDGRLSNLEFFMNSFANGSPENKTDLLQRFTNFYNREFGYFRSYMQPIEKTKNIMLSIEEKKLKKVIATNPMFPMNVQMMRLEWAGLKDIHFDLVTSVENSNYCKPRLEYFEEVCEKIGVEPSACLMVGNDPFNDIIASKTGMKTFLTTDSAEISIELSQALAKKMVLEMPEPDFKGALSELPAIIDKHFEII